MNHKWGNIFLNDVKEGLLMLDHTLTSQREMQDLEYRIMNIQNLVTVRHLDRAKIAPDQAEEYFDVERKLKKSVKLSGLGIQEEWVRGRWSIGVSYAENREKDPDDLIKFKQLVAVSIRHAISDVVDRVDWDDVPQIDRQNVHIIVCIPETDSGSVQVMQQAIWKKEYDQSEDTWKHEILLVLKYNHGIQGLTSISGLNLSLPDGSTPKSIMRSSPDPQKEMLGEYYRRVVIHELGHILHALLHPIEFALLNPASVQKDILEKPKYKIEDNISTIFKEPILLNENKIPDKNLIYARNNEREAIAELFTAMMLGCKITPDLYKWYILHGGPKLKPNVLPDSPLNAPH